MLYDDLVKYRRMAKKDNDAINVYIDKYNNLIYRKSWAGIITRDMVARLYDDDGYKALKYTFKYNNDGITIIYERDDNLAQAIK